MHLPFSFAILLTLLLDKYASESYNDKAMACIDSFWPIDSKYWNALTIKNSPTDELVVFSRLVLLIPQYCLRLFSFSFRIDYLNYSGDLFLTYANKLNLLYKALGALKDMASMGSPWNPEDAETLIKETIIPLYEEVNVLNISFPLLDYSRDPAPNAQIRPRKEYSKTGWKFIPVSPTVLSPASEGLKYYVTGLIIHSAHLSDEIIETVDPEDLWNDWDAEDLLHDLRKMYRYIDLTNSFYKVFREKDTLTPYEAEALEGTGIFHSLLGEINDACYAWRNFDKIKDKEGKKKMEKLITEKTKSLLKLLKDETFKFIYVGSLLSALK